MHKIPDPQFPVSLASGSNRYFEPADTFEGENDSPTRVWVDDIKVFKINSRVKDNCCTTQ